jgi:hypothetical protein
VSLEGNQSRETIKQAYQDTQFVLLPSDSEGWPKQCRVCFGVVFPLQPLFHVSYMLDYGKEVSIRFGFRKRRKCNGASSC